MENVINIIAGVIGVYFLIGMMMFFRYFYFKKGSLKKSLLHILLSLVLLTGLVFVYINQNKFTNTTQAAPGTFTTEIKEMLDNKKPEDVKLNDAAQVAMLTYYKWDTENEVYLDKVKQYYIYYHMNSGEPSKTKEAFAEEFDNARVAANMAK